MNGKRLRTKKIRLLVCFAAAALLISLTGCFVGGIRRAL